MRANELNACALYENISENLTDAIYHRSASLSPPAAMDFEYQSCHVSRMEITSYGGHIGSETNTVDLKEAHYGQQYTLLANIEHDGKVVYQAYPSVWSQYHNMVCP